MDIKFIKNSEKGICSSLGGDLLLQITDANYQLLNRTGKRLFILNTKSNERFEISPEIKKYHFTDIEYAAIDHDYIFFTSVESVTETVVAIKIYKYSYDTNESVCVYVIESLAEKLNNSSDFKLFALDESHFIFESFEQDGSIDAVIRDITTGRNVPIKSGIVAQLGIFKLICLGGNTCMIKFGSVSTERKEVIALVNIKQFLSELSLEGITVNINELDVADDSMTIPYMRLMDDTVIYSKTDISKNYEEIVMYDYKNKVKKVRINVENSDNTVNELNYSYNINGEIYLVRNESDGTAFVNMNTGKVRYKLPASMTFKFIKGDIVVVSRERQSFFRRKKVNYIEVYKITDLSHRLYKIKAEYKDCVISGDDLVIFTL